jgi:hypothetical protein
MTDYVQIEPGGLFVYRWDGERQKTVRQRVKRSRVLTCLRRSCVIKPGTTLRDIFRVVASYKLLKAVVAQYSWCRAIDEFHAQAEEPMRSAEFDGVTLVRLVIQRIMHCYDDRPKGKPPTTYFDSYVDFSGVGVVRDPEASRRSRGEEPPESGELKCSVSCTPMYDLADLPVVLVPGTRILDMRSTDGVLVPIEFETDFSLLEVLDAIYDDISFHGGPSENAAFLEEIQETVQRIKDGEEPLVNWDEAMNDGETGDDE